MEKLSWLESRKRFSAPLAVAPPNSAVDPFLAATGAFDTSNDDLPILSKSDDDGGDVGDVVSDLIKALRIGTQTAPPPLAKRAPGAPMSLFFRVNKIDEERRMVFGCAAAEEADRQNEVMDYAGSKPFFQAWSASVKKDSQGKSAGNVREMHGLSAVGTLDQIQFDDAAKRIEVAAKIIDDDAWKKCVAGVYCGFSIGGRYAKSWQDSSGLTHYVADPCEVSIVDRPAIPSATFQLVKSDGSTEIRKFAIEKKGEPMGHAEHVKAIYEHLKESHEDASAHHNERAAGHGARLGQHKEGTPEHEFHKAAHESHLEARDAHDAKAEKCSKAISDCEKTAKAELAKVTEGVAPSVLEDAVRATFLKMFGDTVIPSRVSAIAPDFGIRAVPRAGSKAMEAPVVEPQFQKLFSAENEESLRQ
jgi:hypothetical protein